jgi:hypothetical protein
VWSWVPTLSLSFPLHVYNLENAWLNLKLPETEERTWLLAGLSRLSGG